MLDQASSRPGGARRNPICKYFSHLSAEINDGRGKSVASLCRIHRDFVTLYVYLRDLIFDFSNQREHPVGFWRDNVNVETTFSYMKNIPRMQSTSIRIC